MDGLTQLTVMSLLVIIICGVVLFLLRKAKYVKRYESDMKVLSRLSLAPRSYIAKIKVDDKVILVGVSAQNISYLCNLSDTKNLSCLSKENLTKIDKQDLN